ncbi:hypothetical protein PG993_010244 [Apiospora rasikravindrae]|uniref:Uncharacterized protein n=1 Tax=Apiospora rasikravindrae TaxID=990691 RepID=A0ABR1SLP5_9PEZI
MQFSALTALFGLLMTVAPVMAAPAEEANTLDRRGTCGASAGAPIASFPIGGSCSGNGYGCDTSCHSIVQCANGQFVVIASCGGNNCAGNHNGGAVCA